LSLGVQSQSGQHSEIFLKKKKKRKERKTSIFQAPVVKNTEFGDFNWSNPLLFDPQFALL
jgi:hypothetical protein